MPDFFRFISEYFWVIAIAFAVFNYWKVNRDITRTVPPEKAPEARAYLRWLVVGGVLPWAIMGVGQVTGSTPTVWHYFRPQDKDPFVLAWLASAFALACVFAGWVLLAGGAKKIVEFNLLTAFGRRGAKPPSENMVRVFAALGVIIFPIWVYGMVWMNVPLPK